jgi:hypothetical protein
VRRPRTSRAAGVAAVAALAASAALATGAGAAGSSALPTLDLALTGHSVTVSGTEQSGAVSIVSTVTSSGASPILVHLNDGVSIEQAFGAVGRAHGDPNALQGLGAITFSTENLGKGTTTTQTVLQPGTYVALDSQHGNNPAKWPRATFTVTAASSPAVLPKPAATVSAIEFGFRGASVLHDGALVRFADAGYVSHMIDAIRVKNVGAAKQLTALLRAGQDRKANRLATGFVGFLGTASPGAVQQEIVSAAPGTYVLACFMDTQDGREHTRLGMERTIRIVK